MSLTPIYDELRELPITDSAPGTSNDRRQTTQRALAAQAGTGWVGQLAGRQGLGGRHRRPAD